MDYLKFYRLNAEPFLNLPDPAVYYASQAHKRAYLRILRGLEQQRGLSVVIGPAGCGKTTLATRLATSLPSDRFSVHMRVIPHSACADGWLLPEVARALGTHEISGDPARTIMQIQQALLLKRSSGVHSVLMMDEAQMLASASVMQEFRALLNLAQAGRPLLSVVLFGLLELEGVLELVPSLAQRIEIRVELTPMGSEEIAGYVAHRLSCAGGSPDLFTADAIEALRRYSRGVPRVLNTLADNALFEASLAELAPVTAEAVISAADQLRLDEAPSAEPTWIPLAAQDETTEDAAAPPVGSSPTAGEEASAVALAKLRAAMLSQAPMSSRAPAPSAAPPPPTVQRPAQAPHAATRAPSERELAVRPASAQAATAGAQPAIELEPPTRLPLEPEPSFELEPEPESSRLVVLDSNALAAHAEALEAERRRADAALASEPVATLESSGSGFDLELALTEEAAELEPELALVDAASALGDDEPDTSDALETFAIEDLTADDPPGAAPLGNVESPSDELAFDEIPLIQAAPSASESGDDDAAAEALFAAVIQEEPARAAASTADSSFELSFEDPADAALAALEVESPVKQAASEDDDLIDMADFLELEPEAPAAAPASGATARTSRPQVVPVEEQSDGDLDDLFEQIQLED